MELGFPVVPSAVAFGFAHLIEGDLASSKLVDKLVCCGVVDNLPIRIVLGRE